MVSPVLAQAILGLKPADVLGSFEEGQEIGRQRTERKRQEKIRTLSGQALQAGGGEFLKELQGIAPEAALKLGQHIGAQDEAGINDFIRSARIGRGMLEGGNSQGFLDFANQRIAALSRQGRDTAQTRQIRDLVASGNTDRALNELRAFEESVAGARDVNKKAFAPVTIINPITKEKRLVAPTVDPRSGKAELSPFDIPEGFEISKETPEEERAAEVTQKELEKGAEVTGKGIAQRRQIAIDKGLDASEGFANIQRGLELLNSIETGGVSSASLRAKQLFGVEGADEAELSNRLSKAVLKQLKATFGSAFTEGEGARLDRIEAGFGKSTEGNRRLLQQTKRIIQRAAKRGIKAAEAAGDEDAAQDIRDALEFKLDVAPAPQVSAPVGQVGRFQIEVVE